MRQVESSTAGRQQLEGVNRQPTQFKNSGVEIAILLLWFLLQHILEPCIGTNTLKTLQRCAEEATYNNPNQF